MRIVGGTLRGRPLQTPKSNDIRPTSDRTREALFNALGHQWIDDFAQIRVLDLFSGTGALGLEALSRGAKHCVFVEQSVEGRAIIRANIENFDLTGATKIFRRDATKLGPAGTVQPFDLLFADPPYGQGLGELALQSAANGGWLKPKALCVVEETAAAPFIMPDGFLLQDERRYGDTIIRLIQWLG